jgi:cytochrome c oxidase subunit 3
MLHRAKKAYENDNTKAYQLSLLFTVILTIVFMCLQYFGWTQLGGLRKGLGSQYIYALSYLHFAHIIGGIPFLLIFLRNAYFRMKEPVSVLVYFSDPEKKLKLKLLTMYWHFLDGLWIFLVVLFLLSSLIDRFI